MLNVAQLDGLEDLLGSHCLSISSRQTSRSLGSSPLVVLLISLLEETKKIYNNYPFITKEKNNE